MASKITTKTPTIRRILREAQELAASPSADIAAAPLESDLFEWHFTIRGPPGSVYADGIYHGRIALPPTYPLRPPMFRFLTPSGRFEANREICLSISGHHEETWQPAWGLRTALVALRSFMESDPKGQVGGLDATDTARRQLAAQSASFRCAACGRTNAEILAESAEEERLLGGEGSQKEEEVPAELKMVFKDELKADNPAEPAPADTPAPPQPAHAVPVPTPTIPLPEALREPVAAAPAVTTPAQLTQQTQPQTQLQTQPQAQAQRRARARRNSDDGIPLWIDRTIVVLCIILAAMLLRIFFG